MDTTHTVTIAPTTKGHRLWLQGLGDKSPRWAAGTRYNVSIGYQSIAIIRDSVAGKRAVVDSKGGIIDLESKKITAWAEGATEALVHITDEAIIITRAGA